MSGLETTVGRLVLAGARFAPAVAMPALTPFAFVPGVIRMSLLLALSLLAVGTSPAGAPVIGIDQPLSFAVALLGELAMGMTLALAVLLPGTAVAFSARVVDIQSGAAAINIFNPTVRATESMVGTAMRWTVTMCFFAAPRQRGGMVRGGQARQGQGDGGGAYKEAVKQFEYLKAVMRAKVEHPFRVVKRQFGYVKVRYKGLAKNAAQVKTLFVQSNLWMARYRLLAMTGDVRPRATA